jgi:hypothetical protein
LPVLDVRVFFHSVSEQSDGTWTSVNRGGPVEHVRVIAPEHRMLVEMPEQIRTMTAEVNDQVYVVSLEFTTPSDTGPRRSASKQQSGGPEVGL